MFYFYRLTPAGKDAAKQKAASNTPMASAAESSPQLVNQDDSQSGYERCIDGTDGNGNDDTAIAATRRKKVKPKEPPVTLTVVGSSPKSNPKKRNTAKVDSNAAKERIHQSNFSSPFGSVADKHPVSPSDITSQLNFGLDDDPLGYMTEPFPEVGTCGTNAGSELVTNSLCRNFL